MPRSVWKQSEIEFAVPLVYEGYSWTQIAKMLTFENLSGLGFTPDQLAGLEVVNQDRKRDTRMGEILSDMRDVLGDVGLIKVTESQLRDAVVLPQRLTHLSQTDRWKTYYSTYASTQEARYAERVSQ